MNAWEIDKLERMRRESHREERRIEIPAPPPPEPVEDRKPVSREPVVIVY